MDPNPSLIVSSQPPVHALAIIHCPALTAEAAFTEVVQRYFAMPIVETAACRAEVPQVVMSGGENGRSSYAMLQRVCQSRADENPDTRAGGAMIWIFKAVTERFCRD